MSSPQAFPSRGPEGPRRHGRLAVARIDARLLAAEPAATTLRRSGSPSCSSATAFIRRNGGRKGNGAAMELGPAFASLNRSRRRSTSSTACAIPATSAMGTPRGRPASSAAFIPTTDARFAAAASLDQVLAQRIGDATALPSLVLACERPVSGFHESGYSMMYASHVSWSSPVSPVPAELYPSLAFDSLFESRGSRTHASVLDHVREQLRDVSRKVSGSDRAKIDEYANSVREVEGRLARLTRPTRKRAERGHPGAAPGRTACRRSSNDARPADVRHHRAGVPDRPHAHRDDAADEQPLGPGLSVPRPARRPPQLLAQLPGEGIRLDHAASGSSNTPTCSASSTATQEGDGTVLDNCCIMLANEQWTFHNAEKVPLLVGGGLGGAFQTGRTLDFENSKDRKFSSLLMTLMDRMGVTLPRFGDATEPLSI